eukprot:scaffold19118_cov129-Isochrysis_galbana.AAC.5
MPKRAHPNVLHLACGWNIPENRRPTFVGGRRHNCRWGVMHLAKLEPGVEVLEAPSQGELPKFAGNFHRERAHPKARILGEPKAEPVKIAECRGLVELGSQRGKRALHFVDRVGTDCREASNPLLSSKHTHRRGSHLLQKGQGSTSIGNLPAIRGDVRRRSEAMGMSSPAKLSGA